MIEADFFASVEPLNRALRDFEARTGRQMGALVKQSARTLCRTLAEQTHPQGPFASGRRRGQIAAMSDVHRVYVSPQTMYLKIKNARLNTGSRGTPEGVAKAFAKAMSQGNFARAQRILEESGLDGRLRLNSARVGPFDGGAMHKQRRSRTTGRVMGKTPSMVLSEDKGLKRYQANLAQRKVGRSKGAWADCAVKLGSGRGFPAWLQKVGAGSGQVRERLDYGEPHVLLIAKPSYMSRVIDDRSIAFAARIGAGKMMKMIDKVLTYEAARATR